MKKGQFRETGNIWYTRHMTNRHVREYRRDNEKKDNPEKLATFGAQDEEKQNIKTQHNMCWIPIYACKYNYPPSP